MSIAGLLAGSFAASAQEAAIGKGSLYFPPKTSKAYVTIEGPAAITLYAAMKAKAAKDACRDNGSTIKVAGNLSCSRSADGKSAVCDFGIDSRTGRSSAQKPC
jgi:hypothetical protein